MSKLYTPFTFDALEALEIPDYPPLLSPWLRTGESSMVYAPTGIGKSWFALSVAIVVAGGGDYAGWTNDTPRRVAYIDGEMAMRTLKERNRILLPALKIKDREALGKNLEFFPRQGHDGEFFELTKETNQRSMREDLRKGDYGLVVLDNFSTVALEIEDENSSSCFNSLVKFLLSLKADGIACLLVHHSNKGGNTYRGSSKLAVTFDSIIELARVESANEQDLEFSVSFEKYREKRDETTQPRTMTLGTSSEGNAEWSSEISEGSRIDRMIFLAQSLDFANQSELAKAMGVAKGTISKWLTKAIYEKRVSRSEFDKWLEDAAKHRHGAFEEEPEGNQEDDSPDF